MTKHAQQSLKYLLQFSNKNVRFCLICNYISRIDESLQNEFMRLRFNQLPEKDILKFLNNICKRENIDISDEILVYIQKIYKSDIRSMINYLQSNKNVLQFIHVLNETTWLKLIELSQVTNNHKHIIDFLETLSKNYNMDVKNIIKEFLNYIIREKQEYINDPFLEFTQHIMHLKETNLNYYKNYTALMLNKLLSIGST
jgi:replication factor C subunit 3/5